MTKNVTEYTKPLPTPDPDTFAYWEGAKKHELLVKRCKNCSYYCFPPYDMCPKCHTRQMEWTKVSGKGKLYAWTVVYQANDPDFVNEVPYTFVLCQIDEQEDVRLPGNLLDCKLEDISAGMPLEVTFVDVTSEVTLPHWRPATQNGDRQKLHK